MTFHEYPSLPTTPHEDVVVQGLDDRLPAIFRSRWPQVVLAVPFCSTSPTEGGQLDEVVLPDDGTSPETALRLATSKHAG